MSVVAILMLGGVAVYYRMNRGLALQSATSSIESALRSARAFAVHERSPAVVVAEPQPDSPDPNHPLVGSVYALGRQTVSNWHFESPSQFAGSRVLGALGQEATAAGSPTPCHGRIGTALLLDGSGTSLQVTSPYLDGVREGLFIEADVFPTLPDSGSLADGALYPVARKGTESSTSFSLTLGYDEARRAFWLQGAVQVQVGDDGATQTLSAAPGAAAERVPVVRLDEWTHVALAYTRDAVREGTGDPVPTAMLRLTVDGIEVARAELALAPNPPTSGRLSQVGGSLWIGADGTNHFRGRIDELKIAGLVAGETHVIPKNTEVTLDAGGSADGRVHFDGEGRLDPAHHARPVLFRVFGDPVSDDERLVRVVRVNWLGAVEVFNGEPPAEQ